MGYKSLTFVLPGDHSQQISDSQKLSADSLSSEDVLGLINDKANNQSNNKEIGSTHDNGTFAVQEDKDCQIDKRGKVDEWHSKAVAQAEQEFKYPDQAVTPEVVQNARSALKRDLEQISQIYSQKLTAIGCSELAE